jgi:multidrug resistance protein, MATE family
MSTATHVPTSHSLRPRRDDVRRLLTLAAPVVLVQVGLMSMGVVDTIMVGHVSAVDLAGASLGNFYFFTLAAFGMGLLMALDPIAAQAFGAGDSEGVARALQRSLLIGAVLTILLAALMTPAASILALLGQSPEVVPRAAGFIRNSIIGLPAFILSFTLRQSLQAMHRMRAIVGTIVTANLVNVALNWVFVYGHLGSPRLGAPGSGLASSGARWFMATLLLALAWRDLRPLLLPWRRESLAPAPLAMMVRLGLPIGFQYMLESGVFSVVGLLMGRIGFAALAGHQVAINMASFTFMVPLGVSASASVLVGNAIGAGDPARARRAAIAAIILGATVMLISGLAFLLFPTALARVYSSDPAVVAMAATLLPIAALFQVFDGLQVVAIGVLRGAGDTRTPMIVNVIGFWLLGLPLSLGLGFGLGLGPRGLWWGLALGLGVVAMILLARVRLRLGGALKRLRIEDPASVDALSP